MAIIIFGVGQLVLPPLAAHIARQRLARHGKVLSVTVSAFPAIELVFGDAQTVNVRMASYTAAQTQVAQNLSQSAGVSNLNVVIGEVSSGRLKIGQVTMTKRGHQFTGSGQISEANLRASIPLLQSVTPIASSGGAVTLQGTADVPIVGDVTADAIVGAKGGNVVISGAGLLDSFLHLTVWSNPRVDVESISGARSTGGLRLSARWRLK